MENLTLLVEQSRGGDREAFARLVRKYQGMVSAVTLNVTGDHAQSEDLAQETFLTAWRKLPELREPEKLASWFYGIAKRVALHWREKQRNNPLRGAAELDAEEIVDRKFQAEQRQRKREQSLELVWSTVKELPETFREPLLLYYRYSRSVADIAESMALSEETVRQRLSRGRRMLKAEVEKQVEQALESTRPDTAFTMAVLASLPMAASMTASVPGTAAAGAGTTGAQAGWLGWSVILWIFAPIILVTGGFMGLWTALKHSPTVRTRRFMCRSALQWYLFLWIFMVTKLTVDHKHGGWDQHGGLFFFSFFPILIAFCCWLVYRWRMLLEEDAGLRPMSTKPLEKTSLSLFWLRCWHWVTLVPVLILSVLLLFDILHDIVWRGMFEKWIASILWMSIPIGFFVVVRHGLRTARNEESLLRWIPKNNKTFLPKPEEMTKFPLFFIDVFAVFLGTIFPVIPLVIYARYTIILDGVAAWVLYSTMMMVVATLIVSHSAGIPGKRLDGYAKAAFFAGLWYVILIGRSWHYCVIPVIPGVIMIPLPLLFGIVYFGTALVCWRLARRRLRQQSEPVA